MGIHKGDQLVEDIGEFWDDDRKAASFVTKLDSTVLTFAKGVVGDVRDRGPTVIDPNLHNAMALFAGMWLYGLNYVVDPQSSYAELSENSSAVDYLQFPRQTLQYRAGDCDDLAILDAALLESVGVLRAWHIKGRIDAERARVSIEHVERYLIEQLKDLDLSEETQLDTELQLREL